MARYYLGVDWGDTQHAVWVCDEAGAEVVQMEVEQTPEGMGKFGHWLHACMAKGIELWSCIEKPEGRIVDFLLDHGVVVYPINPKSADRARDRFRMSRSKSDLFDAYVLAHFVRTDHPHLRALRPNSAIGSSIVSTSPTRASGRILAASRTGISRPRSVA